MSRIEVREKGNSGNGSRVTGTVTSSGRDAGLHLKGGRERGGIRKERRILL